MSRVTAAAAPAQASEAAVPGGLSARTSPARERTASQTAEWLSFLARHDIRPKLTISNADDADEREADAVADRMLRMTVPAEGPLRPSAAAAPIQRACCAGCAEEDEEGHFARKAREETVADRGAARIAADAVSAGGEPLGGPERSFFEPRLGRDLSAVRIHKGTAAERAAISIGALAYTSGTHIAFAAGQYRPKTGQGLRLLAHELAHVAQQGSGSSGRIQRMGDPTKIPAVLSCTIASSSAPIPNEPVFFPNRGSSLSAGHRTQIGNYVDRYHESGSISSVQVDGFASEPGEDALNWQLSCNRASAVKDELAHPSAAQHGGIPESSIRIVMQGETREFGDEAQNRRATIFPRIDGRSQSPFPQPLPTPTPDPTPTPQPTPEPAPSNGGGGGGGPTDAGVGDTPPARPSCAENPECPDDYCLPFPTRREAIADRDRDGESVLSTIGSANARAVDLFRRYIFSPGPAGDISAQHAADFTSSRTTRAVTERIHAAVRADIQAHPPVLPAGGGPATVNYETDPDRAVVRQELNRLATDGLIFDNPLEVPGLLAGGIGTTQGWCAVGQDTSHSQEDSRSVRVTAEVFRNVDGTYGINPDVLYTVVDTIDFCPGNCGGFFAQHIGRTVQMSRWEASGVSGDVPFTVTFAGPALIGAYDSEDW